MKWAIAFSCLVVFLGCGKPRETGKPVQEVVEVKEAKSEPVVMVDTPEQSLEKWNQAFTGATFIESTAVNRHGILVVEVVNDWHYQPKPIRLQVAQKMHAVWRRVCKVGLRDFSIVDHNGNEVGGRGLSGVWVAD